MTGRLPGGSGGGVAVRRGSDICQCFQCVVVASRFASRFVVVQNLLNLFNASRLRRGSGKTWGAFPLYPMRSPHPFEWVRERNEGVEKEKPISFFRCGGPDLTTPTQKKLIGRAITRPDARPTKRHTDAATALPCAPRIHLAPPPQTPSWGGFRPRRNGPSHRSIPPRTRPHFKI